MYWDIIEVRPSAPLTLLVRFQDNTTGCVELTDHYLTGVFAPLKNPEFFNRVFINNGAVTWPGELDLAPDAMYHEIKKHGKCLLKD
jgi:hypothetical protein